MTALEMVLSIDIFFLIGALTVYRHVIIKQRNRIDHLERVYRDMVKRNAPNGND